MNEAGENVALNLMTLLLIIDFFIYIFIIYSLFVPIPMSSASDPEDRSDLPRPLEGGGEGDSVNDTNDYNDAGNLENGEDETEEGTNETVTGEDSSSASDVIIGPTEIPPLENTGTSGDARDIRSNDSDDDDDNDDDVGDGDGDEDEDDIDLNEDSIISDDDSIIIVVAEEEDDLVPPWWTLFPWFSYITTIFFLLLFYLLQPCDERTRLPPPTGTTQQSSMRPDDFITTFLGPPSSSSSHISPSFAHHLYHSPSSSVISSPSFSTTASWAVIEDDDGIRSCSEQFINKWAFQSYRQHLWLLPRGIMYPSFLLHHGGSRRGGRRRRRNDNNHDEKVTEDMEDSSNIADDDDNNNISNNNNNNNNNISGSDDESFATTTSSPLTFGSNYDVIALICRDMRAEAPWRALVATFVHVDTIHLLGNTAFFFVASYRLETRHGTGRTILVYLLSLYTSSLTWSLAERNPHAKAVGSSGAVSGLLGALGSDLALNAESLTFVETWLVSTFLIYILLSYGGAAQQDASGAVGHSAHLGGLLTGYCVGCAILKDMRVVRCYRV